MAETETLAITPIGGDAILKLLTMMASDIGDIKRDCAENNRQNEIISGQQIQLLDLSNQLSSEQKVLANEVVALRARVSAIEERRAGRQQSWTNEEKNVRTESERVVAAELPAQTEQLNRQTHLLAQTNLSTRWTGLVITLAILATAALNNCSEILKSLPPH